MNDQKITQQEIAKIVQLRRTGHSLPEIKKIVRRGSSTIFKYIQGIQILPEYQEIWRIKRGGSKYRSIKKWEAAEKDVDKLITHIDKIGKMLIAACLYWGEGTKKDFSLSNTDPNLIKTFTTCLKEFGIDKKQLRVTIRIYEDLDRDKVIKFWANIIGIPQKQILNINVLKGKKHGKLAYGMCRIRVTKGERYFKLLQSTIKIIKRRLIKNPL